MRFIHALRAVRLTPLALALLAASTVLPAQEGAGGIVEVPDDDLQTITLDDPGPAPDASLDDGFVVGDLEQLPESRESAEERLRSLFKLYKDAVTDSMYAEADTLAKQIVELAIEINGIDNVATAHAITNLAIAQHGSGDYESAKLNFQSAIGIIERISDRLNEDLINPLKGLGATELALGNTEAAAETFQRARHISHVNYGPHNLEQVEILGSLAETFLTAGDVESAISIQDRIFSLQARNIDLDSEQALPALYTQAHWLHRLQQYDRERYTWRRVIGVLEDHRGQDDLSLILPLTEMGKSYLYISVPDANFYQPTANTSGEVFLKRALRIAEENPESDWEIRSQAMLALADYYVLTDKPSRAERMYRDTWELLSMDADHESRRHDELQSMHVLQEIRPPRFYGVNANTVPPARIDNFEFGTIVYKYSVTSRGRPTNIELVEAQPEVFDDMERAVARELRRMIQRPRIVDGETVQADNLTYTHNFYYRESDLPATTTAADAAQD